MLRDKRIAKATHNMLAYRFTDARGVLVSDNDDDGESSSGAKLASLLELTNSTDVIVVVSRWFGGGACCAGCSAPRSGTLSFSACPHRSACVSVLPVRAVLLGPARFKYIASVGRALLEEAGFCSAGGKKGSGASTAKR